MAMPDVSVLDVRLHGRSIATLTRHQGDRTILAFNQSYIDDVRRPTLSLSFHDAVGELITDFRPVRRVVPPFFSNLLPEGPLRNYLAARAGVKVEREFFLLWALGADLPGAVSVHSMDGKALPPPDDGRADRRSPGSVLRFSVAGVQLKFSAVRDTGKGGGLTIPAEGVGGSWIVKLPSFQFDGVPENEFSMMTLARRIGIDVPDLQLVDPGAIAGLPEGLGEVRGQALAIRRFDRGDDGPIHIEDLAQVFGVYPHDKYAKVNYRSIASLLEAETGEADIAEFIRRLVFSTLIGNADLHLKNWSLIYPDRRRPALAPAYDVLSTIPYIAGDAAALNYSRTRRMSRVSRAEFAHLAAKARLPEKRVLDTVTETVERFKDVWATEKTRLPLAAKVVDAVDAHARGIPLYHGL